MRDMAPRSSRKASAEISYPHEIKKHGISVKVYRIEKPSRGSVYVLVYYRTGVRHRDSFRDETKALQHAETTANALAGGKGESLALGTVELESYRHAKQVLGKLATPPPLHSALQEFVAVKALLGDVPLVSAVERFMGW